MPHDERDELEAELFIDRSGAHWRLDAMPEVELERPVQDTTAAFGLRRPTIWSQGGQRMKVRLAFDVFVPVGARSPDVEAIARAVMEALSRTGEGDDAP